MQIDALEYIGATDLEVDGDGQCFLNPAARLSTRGSYAIQVVRREDGFHVTVISKDSRWKQGSKIPADWFPVVTITIDFDPKLDSESQLAELEAQLKKAEGLTQHFSDLGSDHSA